MATTPDLQLAASVVARLRARLRASVFGRDAVLDQVILALLADGHVLLEDYPGSGKTTLAKALGDSIIDDVPDDDIVAMRRIQFTPDLLPSDITGTTIFDPDQQRFFFRTGPLFAYVVLADEINRTSPKVQSALLEAMGEKQVTVDNHTRKLDELFFVIATQNPLDLAGTFPLPVAQLDRFLFKIRMVPIHRDDERRLLDALDAVRRGSDAPRVARQEILHARQAIRTGVLLAPEIKDAMVDIAQALRSSPLVAQGVSTRALVLLVPALQTRAVLQGRDHVTDDDLAELCTTVFAHRIQTAPGAPEAEEVVRRCCKPVIDKLARRLLRPGPR
jgi:MoxR-like ATPase